MDLKIAKERVLIIQEQFDKNKALETAQQKKMDAFGTLNKFTGLFSKPIENDFEIIYREHRFQPFWHIASQAKYIYDRNSHYQYDLKGDEVKIVTVEGKDHTVANGHLHIPVVEHCNQDLREEILIDGVNGTKDKSLKDYTLITATVAKGNQVNLIAGKDAVIVPPQARVSGIIREMLANMIQGIQADKIFEEKIEITSIDLYYRPVYAFEFNWRSKNKKAIIEFDAITGQTSTGTRTFSEYLGKAIDRDFLFDIGADAAGILIPGGSIAVKAARKIINHKKK